MNKEKKHYRELPSDTFIPLGMIRCCFCGKEIKERDGNDPRPIISLNGDSCCNECNKNIVIPTREKSSEQLKNMIRLKFRIGQNCYYIQDNFCGYEISRGKINEINIERWFNKKLITYVFEWNDDQIPEENVFKTKKEAEKRLIKLGKEK